MRHLFKLLFVIFLLSGCGANKQVTKEEQKKNIQTDVVEENKKVTTETQKGGNIDTKIIPEKDRERDLDGKFKELKQVIEDRGLTKTIWYKPDGSVETNCHNEDLQRQIVELNKKIDQSIIQEEERKKEKEEEFKISPLVMLYFMGGIVVIVCVFMFFIFKKIDAQSKVFNATLEKILQNS